MIYFPLFGYLLAPSGQLIAILILTPMLFWAVYFAFKLRHVGYWDNGIFPPTLPFKEKNLMEAYVCLAVSLILINKEKPKGKIRYVHDYLGKYFHLKKGNMAHSFVSAMHSPIAADTVTRWLKRKVKTEGELSQVIYFLAGIAFVDGQLVQKENEFLIKINHQLGLSEGNLTRILSIFASYEQQKRDSQEKVISPPPYYLYYQILGVGSDADKGEIKKAYRNLVKIHHPDNFATSPQSQQRIAADKFMEIQRAYEELMGR